MYLSIYLSIFLFIYVTSLIIILLEAIDIAAIDKTDRSIEAAIDKTGRSIEVASNDRDSIGIYLYIYLFI
jgi:hypothetical protein